MHLQQGCIRREETSEAAPEAVRQAVGGGYQSGWGRLLSVTNAIEAGACRQGDSGWAWAGRPAEGGATRRYALPALSVGKQQNTRAVLVQDVARPWLPATNVSGPATGCFNFAIFSHNVARLWMQPRLSPFFLLAAALWAHRARTYSCRMTNSLSNPVLVETAGC